MRALSHSYGNFYGIRQGSLVNKHRPNKGAAESVYGY